MAPELQPVSSNNSPKYIPIDVLISLSEQGKNNTQIAKEIGCDISNISHRFRDYGYTPNRSNQIDKTKKTVFNLLQSKIINTIRSDEIEKAAFQTKIWAVGVLEDKIQNIDKKAQIQSIDDQNMEDLTGILSRIVVRSPIVVNNIMNVMGSLPSDIRDRLSGILPNNPTNNHVIDYVK